MVNLPILAVLGGFCMAGSHQIFKEKNAFSKSVPSPTDHRANSE